MLCDRASPKDRRCRSVPQKSRNDKNTSADSDSDKDFVSHPSDMKQESMENTRYSDDAEEVAFLNVCFLPIFFDNVCDHRCGWVGNGGKTPIPSPMYGMVSLLILGSPKVAIIGQ